MFCRAGCCFHHTSGNEVGPLCVHCFVGVQCPGRWFTMRVRIAELACCMAVHVLLPTQPALHVNLLHVRHTARGFEPALSRRFSTLSIQHIERILHPQHDSPVSGRACFRHPDVPKGSGQHTEHTQGNDARDVSCMFPNSRFCNGRSQNVRTCLWASFFVHELRRA